MSSRDKLKRCMSLLTVGVLSALLVVGCSQDSSGVASGGDKQTVQIYAASSLTDALTRIEADFESKYPQVDAVMNFAGSKTLRAQIENGAPADVFFSANVQHYEALRGQGLMMEGVHLLSNEMVIAVSSKSNAVIRSPKDLGTIHKLVLGEPGVPAGDYALIVLDHLQEDYGEGFKERVLENVVSLETNVRQVLMKVELGEADAAIVYRTDAMQAEKDTIVMVDLPESQNAKGVYIAGLSVSASEAAEQFLEYLSGDEARAVFSEHGFKPEQ